MSKTDLGLWKVTVTLRQLISGFSILASLLFVFLLFPPIMQPIFTDRLRNTLKTLFMTNSTAVLIVEGGGNAPPAHPMLFHPCWFALFYSSFSLPISSLSSQTGCNECYKKL